LRFTGGKRGLALLLVSIATAAAADKEAFVAKPVSAYPHRQTSEKLTIAAQPYQTDEETHEAFGKLNPWRYGVLPVLIVIQNDTPHAVRVDHMKFIYTLPDRTETQATPAADVKYLEGARQPRVVPGPLGGLHPRVPKNPLTEWEVEGRSFAAKVIPAGESASGFIYFQTPQVSAAATVVISGLFDPVTGKDLYYFEIPMSGN
jgi:hypothetical protein